MNTNERSKFKYLLEAPPEQMMEYRGYLRTSLAAAYLSISSRTLREWARKRLVRSFHPTARTCLFRKEDLDSAMNRFATGGAK